MKVKFLLPILLAVLPFASADAGIIYRVEQTKTTTTDPDSLTLAQRRRFYIGGMYNYSMWQDFTNEDNLHLDGKNTSSFEILAGIRATDTFRIEANYVHNEAKWDTLSFTSNTAFINTIFDARIDNPYRLFKNQTFVPYIGAGIGLAWNDAASNIKTDNKTSFTMAALAGIGIEFNDIFALDFGYRYTYLFDASTNTVADFTPSAHQFRAGARIHF